jgi:hypothetical protein
MFCRTLPGGKSAAETRVIAVSSTNQKAWLSALKSGSAVMGIADFLSSCCRSQAAFQRSICDNHIFTGAIRTLDDVGQVRAIPSLTAQFNDLCAVAKFCCSSAIASAILQAAVLVSACPMM